MSATSRYLPKRDCTPAKSWKRWDLAISIGKSPISVRVHKLPGAVSVRSCADAATGSAMRLKYFPENGPASSTVFIPGLVRPEYLIEIEATAVLV